MKRALSLAIVTSGLVLIGAGCSLPKPSPIAPVPGQRAVTLDLDPSAEPALSEAEGLRAGKQPDLPCISFRHRQGFEQWLNAYEKGNDDLAVNLALNAKLPKRPPEKLVNDLRASLTQGDYPEYLCAFDDKGEHVAWTMNATGASLTECRELLFVSIKGKGTISEIKTKDRPASCTQLCKPRIQSPEAFKWQCNIQTEDKRTTWVEAYMDRKTGATQITDCWKDDLGMLTGCTAP